MSHPVRVRGLKPGGQWRLEYRRVAPRAGAWVETDLCLFLTRRGVSHPVRVRGLKR